MSSEEPKRRYSSPKRAAAVEQTDARIVDAAFAVLARMAEEGGQFSLEAVAKEAGVTRLTVHNRFGSRRGLLEAVFDSRASEAGFARIGQFMALEDTEEAILGVVGFFCEFWASDHRGIATLVASGASEPEFRLAMQERNERRRKLFSVLTGRLVAEGRIEEARRADLTDVLFALTSMPFYAALAIGGRGAEAVKSLVSGLARGAIAGGQTK